MNVAPSYYPAAGAIRHCLACALPGAARGSRLSYSTKHYTVFSYTV